ncbi:MAG: hypothetical protein AAF909_12495 [Pseudomonadota bacterium]
MEFMTTARFDSLLLSEPIGSRRSIADAVRRSAANRFVFEGLARPTVVARLIDDAMGEWRWTCVHTLGAGPWASNEDRNLFELYRRALGGHEAGALEGRLVQSFGEHDRYHLRSLLFKVVAFGWDARLFCDASADYFEITHDGVIAFDDPDSAILRRLREGGASIGFVPGAA